MFKVEILYIYFLKQYCPFKENLGCKDFELVTASLEKDNLMKTMFDCYRWCGNARG